jgi:hypothetical protein
VSAPYRVESCRLFRRDELLLSGNDFELRRFAAVLNAANPADARVAPTLRQLFKLVPEFSFGPGPRLLNDGTPMVHVGRSVGRARSERSVS